MATGISVWATNSIQKAWVDELIFEAEYLSNINKFVGTGPNSIIQKKTDLNAKRGDTIYMDLVRKLTGNPVINENDLTGNEEKMEFVSETVSISEMCFAVKKYGKFEDIKSRKNMLSIAKQELALHMRETYDEYIIKLLCGYVTGSPFDGTYAAWTGSAPTTNRKLYGGDWDGASSVNTGDDWMRVRDISRYKEHARVTCGMRPIIIDGVETYAMFLHPYQWNMIRSKDPDYKNAVLFARERSSSNPLWTGISGWWDGVAIYENDHIVTDETYTTAYRALFTGAQAGFLAWGEGPYAMEQDYDYGRKYGVGIGMLWGFVKTVLGVDNFQTPTTWTDDYGVIACEAYAAATAGLASDTEY